MIITRSTVLNVRADVAWEAVKRVETFTFVTRGTNGYRGIEGLPSPMRAGARVTLRLVLLGVVPAWTHTLAVESVNDARRELQTREHGGPIRVWNHLIRVEPLGDTRCRYTDVLDLHAGILTPLVGLYAHAFFVYRQARWRTLAKRLRAPHAPHA